MIELQFLDKNGREASNGDEIRYFLIEQEVQDEWGRNIPNGHYRHQCGVSCRWVTKKLEPAPDGEWWGLIPPEIHYTRDVLCALFDLPCSIDDEEFDEYVLAELEEHTDARGLEAVLEEINGFEIVEIEPKPY